MREIQTPIGTVINGYVVLDSIKKYYNPLNTKIFKLRCLGCNTEYVKTKQNLKKGNTCRICANNRILQHPSVVSIIKPGTTIYNYVLEVKCPKCEQTRQMRYDTLRNKIKQSDFTCSGCKPRTNVNPYLGGLSYSQKAKLLGLSKEGVRQRTIIKEINSTYLGVFRSIYLLGVLPRRS